MRLTGKQAHELKILRYWIPSNVKWKRKTQKQVQAFFAWSDRGIPHGRNVLNDRDGFCSLYWAKNRRDLQIQSYIEDWGTTMNAWSFDGMPQDVVMDISKRMQKAAIVIPIKRHREKYTRADAYYAKHREELKAKYYRKKAEKNETP